MAKSKIELILELKDRMTTSLHKAKDAVSASTNEMKQKMNGLKTSFVSAVSSMRQELPLLDKALRLLANPIMMLTTIVGAVGMGVRRLQAFANESIATYQVQAEAETKLAQVMRNTMGARHDEIESIKQLASEQQKLGVIGDEVQLAGAQKLGTYLTEAKNLKALLPVMNDIVAQQHGYNATQESAVGIATMMSKAMDGQVGALGRYYKFNEAQEAILKFGTEEQRVATLAEVVQQAIGGVNAALAQTPEGALKQYENNLGDVQERFGKVFTAVRAAWLPVNEALMNGWARVVAFFENNKDRITAVISNIANVVSAVINRVFNTFATLKKVATFIYQWRDAIYGAAIAYAALHVKQVASVAMLGVQIAKTVLLTAKQWLFNIAMNANPVGLLITAISLLIGYIVHLCRQYEGWATVWNAVKVSLVNSFKEFVATFRYGFVNVWDNIQIFWQKLVGFAEHASQLFENVKEAMQAAFRFDFDEAKKILNREITTTADARIKVLQNNKEDRRERYQSEGMQRAKEVADAWKSVDLRKKVKIAEQTSEDTVAWGEGGSDTFTSSSLATGADGTAEAIAGSAKQIRNITVNIDAFNKGGINTTNTQGLNGMSATDIEDWFNQMLLRAIRNVELSY